MTCREVEIIFNREGDFYESTTIGERGAIVAHFQTCPNCREENEKAAEKYEKEISLEELLFLVIEADIKSDRDLEDPEFRSILKEN